MPIAGFTVLELIAIDFSFKIIEKIKSGGQITNNFLSRAHKKAHAPSLATVVYYRTGPGHSSSRS